VVSLAAALLEEVGNLLSNINTLGDVTDDLAGLVELVVFKDEFFVSLTALAALATLAAATSMAAAASRVVGLVVVLLLVELVIRLEDELLVSVAVAEETFDLLGNISTLGNVS